MIDDPITGIARSAAVFPAKNVQCI